MLTIVSYALSRFMNFSILLLLHLTEMMEMIGWRNIQVFIRFVGHAILHVTSTVAMDLCNGR